MPTQKSLAQEYANLHWSIEELQAAVLKEIKVLETGFFTGKQFSNSSRGSHSTAAFLMGIKGTPLCTVVRRSSHVCIVRVIILPVCVK